MAVSDLAGAPLAERAGDLDIALGPDEVLTWVSAHFAELLEATAMPAADVRGIGDRRPRARSSSAPDARSTRRSCRAGTASTIPDWFADRYGAPVLVDNDVNIMARGEHWVHWRDTAHLLLVKVGTGIGCGIVADGHIHRGARGAAGDIGHIRATDATT